MSPEDKAAVSLAVRTELARTAVDAARRVQRILSREHPGLQVTIGPSDFVDDFVIHLDTPTECASIRCMSGESPSAWLAEGREFIEQCRRKAPAETAANSQPS